jgi:serine/threonine protein kinase
MTLSFGRERSYAALESEYVLGEELGSGGFGKVKLATHILTGMKVAIKIIDKAAIGVRSNRFFCSVCRTAFSPRNQVLEFIIQSLCISLGDHSVFFLQVHTMLSKPTYLFLSGRFASSEDGDGSFAHFGPSEHLPIVPLY